MGAAIDDYRRLECHARMSGLIGGWTERSSTRIDFGNLITNIPEAWVRERWGSPPWQSVEAHIKAVVHSRAWIPIMLSVPT